VAGVALKARENELEKCGEKQRSHGISGVAAPAAKYRKHETMAAAIALKAAASAVWHRKLIGNQHGVA
jgi:hypothetical protein